MVDKHDPERLPHRDEAPKPSQASDLEARERLDPRFDLGQVVATPGALELLDQLQVEPRELLDRHIVGDWGDLDDEDKQENELSIKEGFRLLSSYTLENKKKVWIITEADRSVTTLLLPEDY